MQTLLPPNHTPLETTLDQVTARLGDVPVPVGDLWSPEHCPESVLAWLAWALSVDEWQSDWPAGRKRAALQNSLELHRHKGSVWSVREALRRLGYQDVEIVEGSAAVVYDGTATYDGTHTYSGAGSWWKYHLNLDLGETAGVTAAETALMRAVSVRYAPASRRLGNVTREATWAEGADVQEDFGFRAALVHEDTLAAGPLYDGAETYDGTLIHGGPRSDHLEAVYSTGGSEQW